MAAVPFNPQLHPRIGGKFAPKGSGTTTAAATQPKAAGGKPAKGGTAKGSAPAPKGGRYSAAQFAQLKALQAQARAGKKLTPAQAHALHVAHQLHVQHQKHVANRAAAAKAMAKAKAAPKPKATPAAKPRKATAKKPAAPATRRVTVQQVNALRAAGYR